MADRGWKQFERRLCRDMGTERIPVTGERAGADGRTSMFCFQFKLRRALPAWLFAWLGGICGTARPQDRIGVLVVKAPRMRDADAVVMLRWSDWVALHGTATATSVEGFSAATSAVVQWAEADGMKDSKTPCPHCAGVIGAHVDCPYERHSRGVA